MSTLYYGQFIVSNMMEARSVFYSDAYIWLCISSPKSIYSQATRALPQVHPTSSALTNNSTHLHLTVRF